MSSGDGNRSRARQASHQVIGGQRQGGGWGDYTSWRWWFLLVHPPPQPTMGLRDVHEQATCGGSMEPLSDPESQ